jgi:N-acyl-D-amino-acid deacylase
MQNIEYDLVIRGGRVVDGSGFPSYLADIGVKDGKIVEVGRAICGALMALTISGGIE